MASAGCGALLFTVVMATCLRIQYCYYTEYFAVQSDAGVDEIRDIANGIGFTFVNEIMPGGYYLLRQPKVMKKSLVSDDSLHDALSKHQRVKWIEQQTVLQRQKRDVQSMFNDAMWPQQWQLNSGPGHDMNVTGVYARQITGAGVVITIVDDGLEITHPDLVKNYDAEASYDVNDQDADPSARYDATNSNEHGTECAGVAAAEANNSLCIVGVAFNARIGVVRMLDGDVTDSLEAQSMSFNRQHVDIYSASWGPTDDGQHVEGPSALLRKALQDGVEKGRRGLGSIFVWAGGNGGDVDDHCNCDGYISSRYTIAVGSSTSSGSVPHYAELCPAILAVTYSGSSLSDPMIPTTALHHSCVDVFSGTSASAPMAAAICALALQANPRLTWRDMQHIIVRTAKPANLQSDWVQNGAGLNASHYFGFGLMDAGAMVELALEWQTVPELHHCVLHANSARGRRIPATGGTTSISIETDGCHGNVTYLEHVEVKATISATVRGQLSVNLTSPAGTLSRLLTRRKFDLSDAGFDEWPLVSVRSWGESPNGVWTLQVDSGTSDATLKEISLVLYGTSEDPQPAGTFSKPSDHVGSSAT